MNMKKLVILFLSILLVCLPAFAGNGLDEALALYKGSENLTFDAKRGEKLWHKKFPGKKEGKTRDCTACHGKDLTTGGKHVRTGKPIDPMAPSVNKERFTKLKKIKKWFKRNCKWVMGRECTNQEKGDILTYLSQL
jgi:cytochrome c553